MKRVLVGMSALMCTFLLTGCGSSGANEDDVVHLEFFSNKSESIGTYEGMIEKFEKEHPNIDVSLYAPPEAETVLRTRLVKNDLPDVVSLGGNALYSELAQAGILTNYENSSLLNGIQPAYIEMLEELEGSETKGIHGIPYAANANAVIYNKDKMKELNGKVPQTWDEFIALLEKAQDAGEIPIYFTLKDAWTGLIPWNAVGGNLQPDSFAEKKSNGEASFESDYEETAQKTKQLLNYGHKHMYGMAYNEGNNAFANGEGLFYLQGNWAIPELLKVNPEANLGVFPLPVSNNLEENELVSGVDVLLSTLKDSKHPKEAEMFLEFMTEEAQSEQYMEEQFAFSVLEGLYPSDPKLAGFRENFESGRITSFPDHYYPVGMGAENLIQEFYYRKNVTAFLKKMDNEWDKIERRR
ncbi:extracellular solute-binding protein [Priestia filamentosa]|uniref:ABC transporter substrate-binding protein n=1 Tax=Priestia filamentosa TaxID=1402861 RepID=UPI00398298A8